MPRKRKSKTRKKARRKIQRAGAGLSAYQHPLMALPIEERREIIMRLGAEQAGRFAELEPRIRALAGSLDPYFTLSVFAFSTFDTVDRAGEDAFLRGRRSLSQGQLEYLQALLLHATNAGTNRDPDALTEVYEGLPALFAAFTQMRLGQIKNFNDPNTKSELTVVQEFLRGHTLGVRNWAYYSDALELSRAVLAPCDVLASDSFGFKLTHILDAVVFLSSYLEGAVNDLRFRLHQVGQATTVPNLVRRLVELFPVPETLEELQTIFQAAKGSLARARTMALNGVQAIFATAFMFETNQFAAAIHIEPKVASLLLQLLSFAPGDLASEDPHRFFLGNPVWLHPLIAMGSGRFFCTNPQAILNYIFPIADGLTQGLPKLQTAISNSRATVLEDRTAAAFEQALPGARMARNYKWTEGDQQFESDLMVRFDNCLFLIESKSGGVSQPALRGAPERLAKHVRELIVEPSKQSLRLKNHIQVLIDDGTGVAEQFPLDLAGVDEIHRLSVTLEDFATLQSNLELLERAGLLRVSEIAPCILLTDLDVVFNILEEPYERIDYLTRRTQISDYFHHQGDELDLLGFYLDTCFNLDPSAERAMTVFLGMSERFDQYFLQKQAGLAPVKPRRKQSAWLRRLCSRLQKRAPAGWTRLVRMLLRMPANQQVSIEQRLRRNAKRIRSGKFVSGDEDAVIYTPPDPQADGLVFVVHPTQAREVRNARMASASQQAFSHPHIRYCLVMALPAEDPDLNYDAVALFQITATDSNPMSAS